MCLNGRQRWIPKGMGHIREKFGNVYLVVNLIKENLCSDKHVKSALDLRNLADETENASIILLRSKLYAELHTHHMISTIINRLSSHLKSRWRNTAVSMKDKFGTYHLLNILLTSCGVYQMKRQIPCMIMIRLM